MSMTPFSRLAVQAQWLILFAGCVLGNWHPIYAADTGIQLCGIIAPKNFALMPGAACVKPVVAVIVNRADKSTIISDASSLERLLSLEIVSPDALSASRIVLVPPKKFP